MNSKKSIVRYIEVFLDVMVMFTSYLMPIGLNSVSLEQV